MWVCACTCTHKCVCVCYVSCVVYVGVCVRFVCAYGICGVWGVCVCLCV